MKRVDGKGERLFRSDLNLSWEKLIVEIITDDPQHERNPSVIGFRIIICVTVSMYWQEGHEIKFLLKVRENFVEIPECIGCIFTA